MGCKGQILIKLQGLWLAPSIEPKRIGTFKWRWEWSQLSEHSSFFFNVVKDGWVQGNSNAENITVPQKNQVGARSVPLSGVIQVSVAISNNTILSQSTVCCPSGLPSPIAYRCGDSKVRSCSLDVTPYILFPSRQHTIPRSTDFEK
jgi:hypothetical protein